MSAYKDVMESIAGQVKNPIGRRVLIRPLENVEGRIIDEFIHPYRQYQVRYFNHGEPIIVNLFVDEVMFVKEE